MVAELARWGARFLGPPQPGDRLTPRALRLGLHFLSRRSATPARRFGFHTSDGESEERFQLCGGDDGARVGAPEGPVDVEVEGAPFALAALATGRLDPAAALRAGTIRVEGDLCALSDLPLLFDLQPGETADTAASPQEKGPSACRS